MWCGPGRDLELIADKTSTFAMGAYLDRTCRAPIAI